jgi:CheY-like chemotaxis protein
VVYSEPGQGTCVKIYFPAVNETAIDDVAENIPEKALAGSETILLIEDEEAVRKLVRRTLEKHGYQLLVAASGTEALELAQNYTASIQLVISDVVMPQMGGREVAEQLKAVRPGIQILFISGYTENTMMRGGNVSEGETFLQKPFTPLTLARRVREMLDKATGKLDPPRTGRCNT